MLPKLTTKLQALPVSLNGNWRHLSEFHLADPEFGVPGNIDLLLGVDMFSQVVHVHQCWRQGPPDFPMALEMCLGWVLSGTIRHNGLPYREVLCVSTVLGSGEILPKLTNKENSFSHL